MTIITSIHSIPPACLSCSKEGLTCCYYRDDTTVDMVLPVSYTECRNICSFLGIDSITTCFEEEEVSPEFQKNMKGLFPGEEEAVERIFPIGGIRYRFALRGSIKHCVFLTHKGCLLPRNVRPVLCNLFPFWVYKTGSLSLFGNCKLAPRDKNPVESIQGASTSLPELYALYSLLRMFWGF